MIDLSTVESIRAEDVGGRFIVYFDPKAKGSEVGIGFPIKFFSGGLYCDGSTIPPDDFPPSIPIPKESGELFRDNLEMYIDAQCQLTK